MSIRMLWRCRAAVPVALAAAVGSFAGAKPPDLPAISREAVAPQAGSVPANPQPREAEQLTVMPAEITGIRIRPASVDPAAQLTGARRLYLIGERCRREGDLDMAVNCYHETQLLCPGSAYGWKARRRLEEIETRRAAEPVRVDTEEQEMPRPMPRHRAVPPGGGSLPPTDENVLRFLEQVLDTIAAPEPRKIIVELEEASSAPDASEEQEPPVSNRVPVLVVPLPPRNLTIHVDEPETW